MMWGSPSLAPVVPSLVINTAITCWRCGWISNNIQADCTCHQGEHNQSSEHPEDGGGKIKENLEKLIKILGYLACVSNTLSSNMNICCEVALATSISHTRLFWQQGTSLDSLSHLSIPAWSIFSLSATRWSFLPANSSYDWTRPPGLPSPPGSRQPELSTPCPARPLTSDLNREQHWLFFGSGSVIFWISFLSSLHLLKNPFGGLEYFEKLTTGPNLTCIW